MEPYSNLMADDEAFRLASRRLWEEVLSSPPAAPQEGAVRSYHAKNIGQAAMYTAPLALRSAKRRREVAARKSKVLSAPLLPPIKLDVDISGATAEQRAALNMMCLTRDNVFVTGKPGTGKSWLLHLLKMALRERDAMAERAAPSWFVVAPSAKAACDVGGSTVHNLLNMSIFDDREAAAPPDEKLCAAFPSAPWVRGMRALAVRQAQRIAKYMPRLAHRLREIETLVVDEVSMISPALFEVTSQALSVLRDDPRPFGGMVLRIFGDFFQLPPVHKSVEVAGADGRVHESVRHDGFGVRVPGEVRTFTRADGRTVTQVACLDEPVHCFESAEWRRCAMRVVELTEVVRQRGDAGFVALLSRMRTGSMTVDDIKSLESRITHRVERDVPVLMCRVKSVEAVNAERLAGLDGEGAVFGASIHVTVGHDTDHYVGEGAKKRKMTVKVFEQGEAFRFSYLAGEKAPQTWEDMTWTSPSSDAFASGREVLRVVRAIERDPPVPLRLRLKVGALVCMRKNGGEGGVGNGDTGVVVAVDREGKYARVRFDRGGREVHVEAQEFVFRAASDVTVHYMQLPLDLSFARSIHKAQGQTMTRVALDLTQVFEYGQAYVAVSRATSLDGLHILGEARMLAQKCRADPRVVAFASALVPETLEPVAMM